MLPVGYLPVHLVPGPQKLVHQRDLPWNRGEQLIRTAPSDTRSPAALFIIAAGFHVRIFSIVCHEDTQGGDLVLRVGYRLHSLLLCALFGTQQRK